jgi:hypothetical protein
MGLEMRGLGLRLLRQVRMSAGLIWPVSSRRFGGCLVGRDLDGDDSDFSIWFQACKQTCGDMTIYRAADIDNSAPIAVLDPTSKSIRCCSLLIVVHTLIEFSHCRLSL